MRSRLSFFASVLLLYAASASAQITAGQVLDPQQLQEMFTRLSEHSSKLAPMLDQVRVDEWVAKGAPDAYKSQLALCRRMLPEMNAETAVIAQHPDKLTDSMKVLFRRLTFHRTLDSLMGGLRRYQNPALADLILSVASEDQSDLETFQRYLLDTATTREEEFGIVDREAQRCRGLLLKQPPPVTPKVPPAAPKKQ